MTSPVTWPARGTRSRSRLSSMVISLLISAVRGGRCSLAPSGASPDFDVCEVVAGEDARRLAERRVVEIHPRPGLRSVGERDIRLAACVQAAIGIARAVAFDLVERRQDGRR